MRKLIREFKILTEKGISLIELMIAVFLTVLIGAAVLSFYVTQHNQFLVQEDVSDMQQNARVAMDEIAKNIRKAGYGLVGHPSISVGANSIAVYYKDSTQTDSIYYYISRADSLHPHLMKRIGLSAAQVFAENIDSLTFTQSGQLVYVRIVAREETRDQSYIGDKYRRRILSSFVKVRNTI